MKGIITFVTGLFLAITVSSETEMMADDECDLMQYLTIGEDGMIQCSFETFLGLSWYNSEKNKEILFFKPDGTKTGEGFDSGEYDIYPNGSLLVRNVTVDHDSIFTVIKIISSVDVITARYDVKIKTVVKPTRSYPIIDECAEDVPPCLIPVNSDGYVRCHIDKSRPSVNLTWIEKRDGSDKILQSNYSSFSHDNITFMSQTIASYSAAKLPLLKILICQVSSVPTDLVIKQMSWVLLEKIFDYTEYLNPKKVYIEVNAEMILTCSEKTNGAIVWKQSLDGKNNWSTILYTINLTNDSTNQYLSGFNVDSEGSLLLRSIKTEHEGLYACIHQDDRMEDIALYDVKVYVTPVPAYPVVDGCNPQQYCVLHVTDGDYLNCSILGIRPDVNLEWNDPQDTGHVSFEDRTHSVKSNEDTFDVTLSSRVSFSPSPGNRITVQCIVTKSDSHMFELSTTMDLAFENVQATTQPLLPVLLVAIVAVVTVAVILIACIFRKRGIQRENVRRKHDGEEVEETIPMMHDVKESNQPTAEEKLFITQLKTKYEILYDSVQPIPYIKDRMYCVDKVYVDGGIEHLTDVDKRIWRTVDSYHELLSPTCLNSRRQIIEGDPGYGKSTVILQLVYDWCKNIQYPSLPVADIIIYLRLRQLSGVTSIVSAIKRFILPKDTSLSEEHIDAILRRSSKLLLLLDGYDEYPDQEKSKSFVQFIINKELLQDAEVILTTRRSYLPKKFIPKTTKIRLVGFDDEARDKYIRKAVAGDDQKEVEKIKRKLLQNPILEDLCEVPLFFVMFAHMTHENEVSTNFNSVTSFFKVMIECFHSHMRNKMADENVAQFDTLEMNYKSLDKIAFDALNRERQKITWEREELIADLGKESYKQFVRIGILVEEEILKIGYESGAAVTPKYIWEVRFYHKLFCEWYASYHLPEYLNQIDCENNQEVFKYLDPHDLQYLYRFTCGLDENASRKIIQHFLSRDEQKQLVILCMLEQRSNNEVFLEQVYSMVSASPTFIHMEDKKLLQRATIEILDMASKNKIPISCVTLDQSLDKVGKEEIILKSELTLPPLLSMNKIHFETDETEELTEDDVMKIFTYGLSSEKLNQISFGKYLLPLSYSPLAVLTEMDNRNVIVSWFRYGYRLDFQSGLWKVHELSILEKLCSKDVYIKSNDSELQRICTIELLKNASSCNIPISSVNIIGYRPRTDQSGKGLVVYPGVHLPIMKSLQTLRINDKSKVSDEEFAALLNYSSLCTSLKRLWLDNELPETIAIKSIPSPLISRNVQVLRSESGNIKALSFETGGWQTCKFPAYENRKVSSFNDFEVNDYKVYK